MSDRGKPLRFARIEDGQTTPEWVQAAQQAGADAVQTLQPPVVRVGTIEEGVDGGASGTRPASVDWRSAIAPLFAAQGAPGRTLPPDPGRPSLLPGSGETGGLPDARLDGAMAEAQQRFAQAAADLASARQEVLSEVETQLLDLAIKIAEAIIEREVSQEPELHAQLARAALDCLAGERTAELQASPAAYPLLVEAFGQARFEHHGIEVSLVEQPALVGLGCMVETGHVRVDGRVSQRLMAVRRAFAEVAAAAEEAE